MENKNCYNLPPFKFFVLENFPFIEADFDAITNYQLLCKVVEYLNKVISQTNATAEQVQALTNSFKELQEYVDHYFDNLNLQDEVNTKLDEMAEQGQLEEIISQYLEVGTILVFNTVADMQESTALINNSVARTLGYNTINDEKGATYKIVTILDHTPDGINTISLGRDNLYAQLIYENNIKVFNTLQDLANDENITTHDFCKTLGYNSINDGGQGFYYIVDSLESGESANGGNIVELQNDLFAKLIIGDSINVKQFGAVGDNDNDDTQSIQNAITYACQNGYKKVFIPNGTYVLTSKISTPQSFNQPIISGENCKTTILSFSGESCLRIKGGSGNLANSYMENITFKGDDTNICVELEGCCGYDIKSCLFTNALLGVLFHNKTSGEFTEFCVVKDSRFAGTCKKAIEYKRTEGTESFHGSGILNSNIVQAQNETNYKITINSNCLVYNAPLDFACWKNNTSLPIINNLATSSSLKQTFYGNMKIELKTGDKQEIIEGAKIYYCGDLLVLGGYIEFNNILFCEKVGIRPNRSVQYQLKPYKMTVTANSTTTNLFKVDNQESYIVHIRVHTSNYEYQYTLLVTGKQAAEDNTITQLQNGESFNQAGYGAPTFGSSGRYLTITNSQYATHSVSCELYITPIQFFKKS